LKSFLINSELGVNNNVNNYVNVMNDACNDVCDCVGANDDASDK
jgi:hypothetical protein